MKNTALVIGGLIFGLFVLPKLSANNNGNNGGSGGGSGDSDGSAQLGTPGDWGPSNGRFYEQDTTGNGQHVNIPYWEGEGVRGRLPDSDELVPAWQFNDKVYFIDEINNSPYTPAKPPSAEGFEFIESKKIRLIRRSDYHLYTVWRIIQSNGGEPYDPNPNAWISDLSNLIMDATSKIIDIFA